MAEALFSEEKFPKFVSLSLCLRLNSGVDTVWRKHHHRRQHCHHHYETKSEAKVKEKSCCLKWPDSICQKKKLSLLWVTLDNVIPLEFEPLIDRWSLPVTAKAVPKKTVESIRQNGEEKAAPLWGKIDKCECQEGFSRKKKSENRDC